MDNLTYLYFKDKREKTIKQLTQTGLPYHCMYDFMTIEEYKQGVKIEMNKRRLLINHLKKLNSDYIKSKREQQKRYRNTLICGVTFMILFTISIIFLWNCVPK